MLNLRKLPQSRVLLLGMGAVVLGVLFAGAVLVRPAQRKASGNSSDAAARGFDVALTDSRKVAGFVESYGHRVDQAEKDLSRKDAELRDLKGALGKQAKAVDALMGELAQVRERELAARAAKAQNADLVREAIGLAAPDGSLREAAPPPRLEKITLPAARVRAAELARRDEVRLPAGSLAEGTLVTGVYAPTQGSAQPVHLRVDLTFMGPNGSRIPIQGAFLIGKAVGEANSVRAIIQLDRLSFVREGGQVVEVPVNGYVVDQDGVMGLRGIYDWRIHEAAGLAALTGGVAAAADAAAASETLNQVNPLGGVTQVVTGNVGKYALAKGASRAADEVGKIITRRLDELVPAVYVQNGRKLTIVLLDGVTLSGLPLREVKHDSSRSPYAGLDLDR